MTRVWWRTFKSVLHNTFWGAITIELEPSDFWYCNYRRVGQPVMQEAFANLEIRFQAGYCSASFQQRAIDFPAAVTEISQQRKCMAEPGGTCGLLWWEMLFSDLCQDFFQLPWQVWAAQNDPMYIFNLFWGLHCLF